MIQYYADSDANGKINAYYNDDVWDVAKIPTTAIKISEAQWQDSLVNPDKYMVDKSKQKFILTPPPTIAQQLATAQISKIAELQSARDKVITGGFTSLADGTSRVYPSTDAHQNLIHQQTTAMLANVAQWPQSWQDASGNWTSFTQTQFQTFIKDFNVFKHQPWTKFQNLYNQAVEATSLANVNAIIW